MVARIMETVSAPRDVFRFPVRCVECGAPPTRSFALALPPGPEPRALQAPLCERCGERKSLAQLGWIAAGAAAGVALIVVLAVILDALTPSVPALRKITGLLVAALFALGSIPVWLAARSGRRSFHRRFSAVWVEGAADRLGFASAGAADGGVTLGFRSAEICREVAAASGLATGAAMPFRTPGAPAPAFTPRGNPVPSWAVALLGLGVIGGGFAEYDSLGKGGTLRGIEIPLYALFGRAGVLVLFLVFGVALLAVAAGLWWKAQRRQG
jgi:hypothetical protein